MEPQEPASTVNFSEKATSFEPSRPKKGNGKKIIGIVAIILVILGVVLLGLRNSKGSAKKEQVTPEPTIETPTDEPTQEPTPETSTTLGKTTPTPRPTTGAVTSAHDMAIQVLNGSGEAGVATTGRDFLKGKGYTNLETGNADNFDYQGVTIKIKSSRQKFLDTLSTDVKGKYTLSASGSGTLAESALFDAQVIIGK